MYSSNRSDGSISGTGRLLPPGHVDPHAGVFLLLAIGHPADDGLGRRLGLILGERPLSERVDLRCRGPRLVGELRDAAQDDLDLALAGLLYVALPAQLEHALAVLGGFHLVTSPLQHGLATALLLDGGHNDADGPAVPEDRVRLADFDALVRRITPWRHVRTPFCRKPW